MTAAAALADALRRAEDDRDRFARHLEELLGALTACQVILVTVEAADGPEQRASFPLPYTMHLPSRRRLAKAIQGAVAAVASWERTR